MAEVPLLVVVSGPPAAGKTTIARAVADRLGLPLLAKDAIKEVLGETLGVSGRPESQRLGAATFEVQFHLLRELLGTGCSVVAEGNFAPAGAASFATLPPARIVQVHATAAPALLRERMVARAGRHAVHYDAEVADEVAERTLAGDWPALQLEGELLEVDTTSAQDVDALAERIARMAG